MPSYTLIIKTRNEDKPVARIRTYDDSNKNELFSAKDRADIGKAMLEELIDNDFYYANIEEEEEDNTLEKIEEYGYIQIESQHSENFETCATCGKNGKETEIKKISIGKVDSTTIEKTPTGGRFHGGISICLCKKCSKELSNMIHVSFSSKALHKTFKRINRKEVE
jgi:hypothetical protein